jgi:hypothetical protein
MCGHCGRKVGHTPSCTAPLTLTVIVERPAVRPKPQKVRRRCLKCGGAFPSEGPFNRICARCNAINAKLVACPHTVTLVREP